MSQQINPNDVGLAYDESGQPVIVVRDQGQRQRLSGLEAHKANIEAARAVASIVRSSLGPRGMDKMLVSADGAVTLTNDGATILARMDVEHQIGRLLVDLSRCQDDEVGDGTTGVVVLAGALLEQSGLLLQKGVHPIRVADGYDKACDVAVRRLQEVAIKNDTMTDEALIRAARTSLGSKIVNRYHDSMARLAVEVVRAVWDPVRGDADFSRVLVRSKPGGTMGDTELIRGIVLTEKEFSHPSMITKIEHPLIAVMNTRFEAPKPKTDITVTIDSAEKYSQLAALQSQFYADQVRAVKESGANVVLCQWGFEDEANDELARAGISAVRYVSADDLEAAAIATHGHIVARFEELEKRNDEGVCPLLGRADRIYERNFGTTGEKAIVIETIDDAPVVTLLVRGGNTMVVDEAARSLHDAMCVVRNMLRDPRVVPGGGAAELACSLAVQEAAQSAIGDGLEHYALEAYCAALDSVPQALARNAGLSPIETVAAAKSKQMTTGKALYGIDCMECGTNDMTEQGVYETLSSKVQQLRLATQVCRMVLKIDEVTEPTPEKPNEGQN